MDDSEFDKLYADKIRRAGAPDLSDDDWERLTPRLDVLQRRRWRVLPLWWLSALSGLLLLSNMGWWWMWQQLEQRSHAIQNEWQQLRRESVVLRDTTWSKVVVYQSDTVYLTVVYRAVAGNLDAGKTMAFEQGNTSRAGGHNTTISDNLSGVQTASAPPFSNFDQATIQPDTTAINRRLGPGTQNTELLPIVTAFLETPTRGIQIPENDLVLAPSKRSASPRQSILIPKKFRLGAGGGFVIPAVAQFSEFSGFEAALSGELAFSEQLALTLDGVYRGISFNGEVYDEALGLPPLPSTGDDYVLKHFETEEGLKPIIQLGIGMRYWLRSTHKLSPYLGLGYAAQWHPEFELKLEYAHKISGPEKERSVEVPSLDRPVSFLDFNAGVRYRFVRHLSLQTGAFYQFKIDNNQPGIPQFWGVKSSVIYEF